MRLGVRIFAALFLSLTSLHAEVWKIKIAEPAEHFPVAFKAIQCQNQQDSSRNFDILGLVVLEKKKCVPILVDQPIRVKDKAPNIKSVVQQVGGFIGVNGGYFDDQFLPDGWCVINQKEITPYSPKKVLSGVLYINSRSELKIESSAILPKNPVNAIQTGPFVIDPGAINGISAKSTIKARRTMVGMTDTQYFTLITTSASLYDVADVLLEQYKHFGLHPIDRVINLDGGPSTGMYALFEKGEFYEKEGWTVRNILVFKRK